ncbi:gp111 [Erwinia phage vB_EamP-S6]|uniref:Gp111 n=1 Tax=Erwinia phage vB_EamP-S6 TaxID=1051675 RepID=G0YQK3_9CAUD|nr:gp111 [Erwinia phage vB_EamP-S6]AEJ81630.1 gp111 [Erwinia phage vB_EamP-S6]
MTISDLLAWHQLAGSDGVHRNLMEVCYHSLHLEWNQIDRVMPLLVAFSERADKEWYL